MRVLRVTTHGFPLKFYFRGHKSPLTLIQGDIQVILGDNHMTLNRKKQILGDIMSLIKGNLGDINFEEITGKISLFEGQENPDHHNMLVENKVSVLGAVKFNLPSNSASVSTNPSSTFHQAKRTTSCIMRRHTFFSSPVQSTGRAIVVTLASTLALALTLPLPFPSCHF